MKRTWICAAVAVLALGAAIGAGGSAAHPGDEGGTAAPTVAADPAVHLLPDLVQIMPPRVGIARRRSVMGTRTLLTFASAAENHGEGPLIVRASRPGLSTPTMAARQVVARRDGVRRDRVADAGRVRFVSGGGHSHWHLEGFMRYELRTLAGAPVGRDRKTGFCLGDRYDATGTSRRMAREPARAVYRSRCGLRRRTLTSLTQGISVGYGDDYAPRLEGQYIDITGVRTGRYVLVMTVDPDGRLADLHRDNNVSSMLVKIVRRGGTRARILAWCNSGDRCTTPGVGAPPSAVARRAMDD